MSPHEYPDVNVKLNILWMCKCCHDDDSQVDKLNEACF